VLDRVRRPESFTGSRRWDATESSTSTGTPSRRCERSTSTVNPRRTHPRSKHSPTEVRHRWHLRIQRPSPTVRVVAPMHGRSQLRTRSLTSPEDGMNADGLAGPAFPDGGSRLPPPPRDPASDRCPAVGCSLPCLTHYHRLTSGSSSLRTTPDDRHPRRTRLPRRLPRPVRGCPDAPGVRSPLKTIVGVASRA